MKISNTPGAATLGRPERIPTYLAGLLLGAIVAHPVINNFRPRDKRTDGFPLSYYPMFSTARSGTGKVNHLIGIDAGGSEDIVHYRHAGTGGLNQVRRQINRRVKNGQAMVVARQVANSVAYSSEPADAAFVSIQVVRSEHRYDEFFTGQRTPRRRTILAEAAVPQVKR